MIDEKKLIEKIRAWKEEQDYYDEPTDIEGIESTTIWETLDKVLLLIAEESEEE